MTSKAAAAASSEMFRQSWSLYQKLVASNGMSHVEAYRSLHCALKRHMDYRPFHFVDLACGCATHSSQALQNTKVERYTGIDMSETALSFARQSIQPLNVQKELLVGDFCDYKNILEKSTQNQTGTNTRNNNNNNNNNDKPLDVVWVGLSLHHLETPAKASFMQMIANHVSPSDGMLLIYEPICLPGQTREDYYERFQTVSQQLWSELLDATEIHLLFEHVTQQDIPESNETWLALGKEAGFSHGELIFSDPFGLYSAFCFRMVATEKNS